MNTHLHSGCSRPEHGLADDEHLPRDLQEAFYTLPERLRFLQVIGVGVGSFVFSAGLTGLPLLVLLLPAPLHAYAMAQLLSTPIVGFLCSRWSLRLREVPLSRGIGVGGLALLLAIPLALFVSTPPYARPNLGSILILIREVVVAAALVWLAVIYLVSTPLLFRYSVARVEFPDGIESLWLPIEHHRTSGLLHVARRWSLLSGFASTAAPMLYFLA